MKETKTSEEWQKQFPRLIVYDADGWNRGDWQYSWYEEQITEEEYKARTQRSTCMHV